MDVVITSLHLAARTLNVSEGSKLANNPEESTTMPHVHAGSYVVHAGNCAYEEGACTKVADIFITTLRNAKDGEFSIEDDVHMCHIYGDQDVQNVTTQL